jgi:hypothetical protein
LATGNLKKKLFINTLLAVLKSLVTSIILENLASIFIVVPGGPQNQELVKQTGNYRVTFHR